MKLSRSTSTLALMGLKEACFTLETYGRIVRTGCEICSGLLEWCSQSQMEVMHQVRLNVHWPHMGQSHVGATRNTRDNCTSIQYEVLLHTLCISRTLSTSK